MTSPEADSHQPDRRATFEEWVQIMRWLGRGAVELVLTPDALDRFDTALESFSCEHTEASGIFALIIDLATQDTGSNGTPIHIWGGVALNVSKEEDVFCFKASSVCLPDDALDVELFKETYKARSLTVTNTDINWGVVDLDPIPDLRTID